MLLSKSRNREKRQHYLKRVLTRNSLIEKQPSSEVKAITDVSLPR